MLRTTAISLVILLSVGVMLPFANSAHGVRQSSQVGVRRSNRSHSRAWWKRYRARLRKKRAAAAAAMAHRKATLGQPQSIPVSDLNNLSLSTLSSLPVATTVTTSPTTQPSTPTTTVSVSPSSTTSVAPAKVSDVKTPVKSVAPKMPGQMNISVVALSRPNPAFLTSREESRMVGGTNISDLRSIVIDKMMVSGGWVTNDFVREVNGARVFVVTARTPKDANSPEKAWTFYFTEADGRIYGLSTDAPLETAERMSTEAERFINKLHANSQPNK
jgi:hypothetical protein